MTAPLRVTTIYRPQTARTPAGPVLAGRLRADLPDPARVSVVVGRRPRRHLCHRRRHHRAGLFRPAARGRADRRHGRVRNTAGEVRRRAAARTGGKSGSDRAVVDGVQVSCLADAGRCLIVTRLPRPDRYGRSLATIKAAGRDVTAPTIGAGLARPYDCPGGRYPRRARTSLAGTSRRLGQLSLGRIRIASWQTCGAPAQSRHLRAAPAPAAYRPRWLTPCPHPPGCRRPMPRFPSRPSAKSTEQERSDTGTERHRQCHGASQASVTENPG